MSFDLKALGSETGKVAGTSLHLEHQLARPAPEVMVVAEVCDFVTRRLSGEMNGDDDAVVHHGAQRTVHGGRAQLRHGSPRRRVNLRGTQRTLRRAQHRGDSGALPGSPFHGAIDNQLSIAP